MKPTAMRLLGEVAPPIPSTGDGTTCGAIVAVKTAEVVIRRKLRRDSEPGATLSLDSIMPAEYEEPLTAARKETLLASQAYTTAGRPDDKNASADR